MSGAHPSTASAATLGDADAQYQLGSLYRNGLGVAQDDRAAFIWIERAAQQHSAKAQYHLGVIRGTAANEELARWDIYRHRGALMR